MIEGLRSVRVLVPDLPMAVEWYARALEVEPYVAEDGSASFFVDGYRLTLNVGQPSREDGMIAYWGVGDLAAEYRRLMEIGGAAYQPVQHVDAVTRTAALLDPFGNAFGIVETRDPAVQKARNQRVAEKVAIRNVREVLDDLKRDDERKRTTLRFVLLLCAVVLLVAGLFIWDLVAGRAVGDGAPQLFIDKGLRR